MIPKFKAMTNCGALLVLNQDGFRKHLLSFKKDQLLEVIVRPFRKDRSDNQNRYYHGVVVNLISDHLGYSADETHEVLKSLFLSHQKIYKGNKSNYMPVSITKSTATLKTTEFEDYLKKIREWAYVEFGLTIPLPNEVEF